MNDGIPEGTKVTPRQWVLMVLLIAFFLLGVVYFTVP